LTSSIEPLVAAYEERRQRDQTKLEHMVVYAQTALCRTHVLLEAKAVRQWDAIEERRRALVPRTFSATGPRTE
jgi:hypothetical protein